MAVPAPESGPDAARLGARRTAPVPAAQGPRMEAG